MHIKHKKLLATLLALSLVTCLFTVIPLTASALNANDLKTQIESFDPGGPDGPGTLTATISPANTVTVTGTCTLVNKTLTLNISSGVKVVWKADYYADPSADYENMFILQGSGTFEVASGADVRNHFYASNTILNTFDQGGALIVSGGSLSAIQSARVISVPYGKPYADITISGGSLGAVNGYAIAVESSNASVKITGGDVSSRYIAAVGVTAPDADIKVSGGWLLSSAGNGIYTSGNNTKVTVSGGLIATSTKAAIDVSGVNSGVTVNGGFVFSHGTAISGAGNVINSNASEINSPAVVCAWKKPSGDLITYNTGATTDLIFAPTSGTAVWGLDDSLFPGISYTAGTAAGFYRIDGVKINRIPGATMDNFTKTREYTPGMFTDVNENLWYGYDNQKVIADAYEYGLMSGNSATTFNPSGKITLAEAITVASRVHCLYMTKQPVEFTPVPGEPWYMGNVRYAIENGIIKASDFSQNYNVSATRAQMAYIFAHTLPDWEYVSRWYTKSPPDVSSSSAYYNEIIRLYDSGIIGGSDDAGTFYPANTITRAETAAILARLILPNRRLGTPPMPS